MGHGFKFIFASLKSLLFGDTGGSAYFEEVVFGVLSVLDHSFDFGLDF